MNSTVTREEKLYFDRMFALKRFKATKVRSKFRVVIDEINKTIPITSN